MSMHSGRAERLFAWGYRQIASGNTRTEAFLEEAFAAALEAPEYWQRLRQYLEWDMLPSAPPRVSTQNVIGRARSDIRLTWNETNQLVMELKVDAPPKVEQVKKYIGPGVKVVAVARTAEIGPEFSVLGSDFLGVVTWQRIYGLVWPSAPLEVRQLHSLLEASGVVNMDFVNLDALIGMVRSWEQYNTIDSWVRGGRNRTMAILQVGWPLPWETNDRAPLADRYFGRSIWPQPWNDAERLSVYCGFFLGTPTAPALIEGLPDLVFGLDINPQCSRAAGLATSPAWQAAVQKREGHCADGVCRETNAKSEQLLRDRAPGSWLLLQGENQQAAFEKWMGDRANEWIADGIMSCFMPSGIPTPPATPVR